jgi:hypothetical protein
MTLESDLLLSRHDMLPDFFKVQTILGNLQSPTQHILAAHQNAAEPIHDRKSKHEPINIILTHYQKKKLTLNVSQITPFFLLPSSKTFSHRSTALPPTHKILPQPSPDPTL